MFRRATRVEGGENELEVALVLGTHGQPAEAGACTLELLAHGDVATDVEAELLRTKGLGW